jgi:hypothetical protein
MSIFRAVATAAVTSLICGAGMTTSHATSPGFAQRCEALVAEARFNVAFEDALVTRDNTRSLAELKNLSHKTSGPNHQVFGLTQAQAGARYAMRAALVADADGSVCAVPSLDVTILLTDLTVYLARELVDGCKRAIVDEHELEHVGIWRSHLRAGARLLEPALRNRLAQPFVFASADAAKAGLRGQVDGVLNPLLLRLQDGIVQANRDLDSPQSYQATGQRIHACP